MAPSAPDSNNDGGKAGGAKQDRPKASVHMGDAEFLTQNTEDIQDATWGEVCRACCVHTPQEWATIFLGLVLVCFFLYFFLFGLELLGTGAKVMGGCTAGAMFGDETNPIAGLMVGVLSTVLLQSSSTTTSIIVSLVGAGSVSVRQGIYMVMGANIGTSVTNTIVAIGHLGDGDQLERAFAGATVHDMFNFLSVAVMLPLEAASGYLYYLTKASVSSANTKKGDSWEGPVKKLVEPLGSKVLISNKKVISAVAAGGSCNDFYPVTCEDPDHPTAKTCKAGLIGCDKDTGDCPAFFQADASRHDDQTAGFVVFILALFILFVCLFGLVKILNKMLMGTSSRIIYKATNINGYASMAVGAGITILVQSSSITTSALTPLVGMGVLQLEQMFPLTLGANIGTTVTALLAALVSEGTDSLQVALAHLYFNLTGVIIWYPIPLLRSVPLGAARQLGRATRLWRGFPFLYIAIAFFLLPLLFLGLSALFTQDSTGLTVLGSFIVVFLFVIIVYVAYHCQYRGGKDKCVDCLSQRQRRAVTMTTLPDDMEYLKEMVLLLKDHTGLTVPTDEEKNDIGAKDAKDDADGADAKPIDAASTNSDGSEGEARA